MVETWGWRLRARLSPSPGSGEAGTSAGAAGSALTNSSAATGDVSACWGEGGEKEPNGGVAGLSTKTVSERRGTPDESQTSANLLQMLHEGLGLADGAGHLLHRLGHLCRGHQKFGELPGGIGRQGRFGRRLREGG